MKKSSKYTLIGVVTLGGLLVLSSCNSFCSAADTANFRYAYDPINTTFYTSKESAFEVITDDFVKGTGVNVETFNPGDLVFATDDNFSLKYGGNEEQFFELLFTEINENLYVVNPGQLKYSTTLEGQTTETTYMGYVGLSDFTVSLLTSSSGSGNAGYVIPPSYEFFKEIDRLTLELIVEESNENNGELIDGKIINEDLSNLTFNDVYGYSEEDLLLYESLENGDEKKTLEEKMIKEREEGSLLAHYGYLKHYDVVKDDKGNDVTDYYAKILLWNDELSKTIGADKVMTDNFFNFYKQSLDQRVANVQTCITVEDGFYGNLSNDPLNNTVKIEAKASDFWKNWGDAFTKHGFLEGLLVYPISVGLENMSHAFGLGGWGQIGAVLLMTVIVRACFMLVTLPSTLSQQKMSLLQPEIVKLQQKYPNMNTNQYDKQRFTQAQMALYKKHKVHPLSNMLVLIVQFPLFIAVWNAFRGSASLSSDAVLGLRLSDTIWSVLSNFSGWPSNPGWWTALVLILLMSGAQVLAILVPTLINKRRTKNVAKTIKNPTADSQAKTMKYVQWGMTIFIILSGFMLPAAMGVYWFAGAIFSIIQTLLIQLVFNKKGANKK